MSAAETLLVRSRRGDIYHRRNCAKAGNALPWFWAEGKSSAEVAATAVNGVLPCRSCDPLRAIPNPDGTAS